MENDSVKNTITYYTVGNLREALKGLDDNIPVVSAPLNESIRVALDMVTADDVQLGDDYKGKVVIFSVGLFDVKSGNSINIVPQEQ